MESLKHAKKTLMSCVESQLTHLDTVDAKELGEVVDMVKDLEEAIYYCTITKAMEEGKHQNYDDGKDHMAHYMDYNYQRGYQDPYYRDMDRGIGRMYYNNSGLSGSTSGTNAGAPGNGNTAGSTSNNNSRGFEEHSHPTMYNYPKDYRELEYPLGNLRDEREGRSPKARRMYMESKEMHADKTTQVKELEKYMQELTHDITEMIEGASLEEKQMISKKVSELGTKIAQMK